MVTSGLLTGTLEVDNDNSPIKLSTLDMIRERVSVTLTAVEYTKYLSISQSDLDTINQ
jgi:hypothetical protein